MSAASAIPRNSLERWVGAVLQTAGVGAEGAALAAQILVRTDARGFRTHGVARMKSYMAQLKSGALTAEAAPTTDISGNFAKVEAHNILGQIAAPRAVDLAVKLAEAAPFAGVQLRDSGHLGALGLSVLRAAERGVVGLIFQSTPPIIAVPGAAAPMIGNNPFAMAAPRPNGPPVVVDMACCVAARGNILLAARNGDRIPEGWALDADGEPTTDPDAALAGSLLPFAGHKGLAIAMMVEVLAASLSGATFRSTVNEGGTVRSGTGHLDALILVFNPALMAGRDAYDTHIASWTRHFRDFGGDAARLSGERAHAAEVAAERDGIGIAPAILAELEALGRESGVPFPGPAAAPDDPAPQRRSP